MGGFIEDDGRIKENNKHVRALIVDPLIVELSKKYNKTPGQILIQWNKQRGWSVINTSRNIKRIEELIEIMNDSFQLEDIDMKSINDIKRRIRWSRPGPFSFLWGE